MDSYCEGKYMSILCDLQLRWSPKAEAPMELCEFFPPSTMTATTQTAPPMATVIDGEKRFGFCPMAGECVCVLKGESYHIKSVKVGLSTLLRN